MSKKFWGGRFKKKAHARFEAFSSSLRWDQFLAPHDLAVDLAHVKALKKAGVLSSSESSKLLKVITQIRQDWHFGKLKFPKDAEDVHSALHTEIKHRAGGVADKLHTGRSRNDLVAQSSRLYVKSEVEVIRTHLSGIQGIWVRKAKDAVDTLMPGMTHMQNAQVVSVAHIFLSYVEMLERAKDAYAQAAKFADVCVVGSGALAGVTFNLDQKLIAKELGLASVTRNSYDVSGDRDFVVSFLSASALLGTHLSRIAEDLMIGQLKATNWVDIDEAFCTGSSMMPQKKNADFVELLRGASGVFTGNLVSLLTTLKGLPSSYNRDLQWDKRVMIESAQTMDEILDIFSDMVYGIRVKTDSFSRLLADESLYATDLADYLVGKGVSFCDAHEQVGGIVSLAEETGLPISKIGLDLLKKHAPKLDGGVYDLFNAKHSASLKKTTGSTHPDEIRKQIRDWGKRLGKYASV